MPEIKGPFFDVTNSTVAKLGQDFDVQFEVVKESASNCQVGYSFLLYQLQFSLNFCFDFFFTFETTTMRSSPRFRVSVFSGSCVSSSAAS